MRKMIAGILTILCCYPTANAQSITPEMVAVECERQMSLGICSTRPDRSKIVPGQTIMMSGIGRVSYSAYLDFMDLYDAKNPSETAMCKLALKYMKLEPNGDHSKIARALWTPTAENKKK